jgi:hypothetical protein
MNFLGLDIFRAGLKGKPGAKIHYYVMPHWPGNTLNSWRRQFYGDLGHGMKVVNLFEFRPVQAAYTENHCSLPAMYAEVRKAFYELGQFEDIIQDGSVQPGQAALWFSEAGDIWGDNEHPFGAGKRTLYIAIRHQQLPLDIVIDEDATAGDLKAYRVLYLADRHVGRGASQAIADWVAAGGRLLATADAGMFDEFNKPNTILREVMGVVPKTPEQDPEAQPIQFVKQDLPWVEPLDTVTWRGTGSTDATSAGDAVRQMPVVGIKRRFQSQGAEVLATYADGSPAVSRKAVGQGSAIYCGFLPGLSYFYPAIPRRPVDRGSSDDSMAHFIPTKFDSLASTLVGLPAEGLGLPVTSSVPLVESSVVRSTHGTVIPLVNWSGEPIKKLTVTVILGGLGDKAELASGRPLQAESKEGKRVFTLELDVADALILR